MPGFPLRHLNEEFSYTNMFRFGLKKRTKYPIVVEGCISE